MSFGRLADPKSAALGLDVPSSQAGQFMGKRTDISAYCRSPSKKATNRCLALAGCASPRFTHLVFGLPYDVRAMNA